jgi:hypothetical protein
MLDFEIERSIVQFFCTYKRALHRIQKSPKSATKTVRFRDREIDCTVLLPKKPGFNSEEELLFEGGGEGQTFDGEHGDGV